MPSYPFVEPNWGRAVGGGLQQGFDSIMQGLAQRSQNKMQKLNLATQMHGFDPSQVMAGQQISEQMRPGGIEYASGVGPGGVQTDKMPTDPGQAGLYGVFQNYLGSLRGQAQQKQETGQAQMGEVQANTGLKQAETDYKRWLMTPEGQQSKIRTSALLKDRGGQEWKATQAALASGDYVMDDVFKGMGQAEARMAMLEDMRRDYPGWSPEQALTRRRFALGEAGYASSSAIETPIVYMKSVMPNLDHVVLASNKLDKTKYPVINRASLWGMRQTGDPDVVGFATAALETADQVAKILQGGGSGNATSDAKLKQANDMFDAGLAPDQFARVASELKVLLSNRLGALEAKQAPYKKHGASAPSFSAPKIMPAPGVEGPGFKQESGWKVKRIK